MKSKINKEQVKWAEDMLTVLAKEQGISTERFFDSLDILNKYTLEDIACALTHFCFRNGPIEDMHTEGKLSQDEMKILNKYCYDKIFTFLTMMKNNEIGKLYSIIESGLKCGVTWDKPEYRED